MDGNISLLYSDLSNFDNFNVTTTIYNVSKWDLSNLTITSSSSSSEVDYGINETTVFSGWWNTTSDNISDTNWINISSSISDTGSSSSSSSTTTTIIEDIVTSSSQDLLFFNATTTCCYNTSSDDDQSTIGIVVTTGITTSYNWFFLILLIFVVAGGLGNTLVCLAICLERRLQNVTNYFLLSLSVADLLVSLFVMPFSIIVGFVGHWPFDTFMCDVYVSCDVLACSSSIMHMCFISIGRYMGIRNPLKTRITSKKVVAVKIVLVWLLSMVITSPISILGLINAENIQSQSDTCAINNRFFFIFGSLFAFYIPMVIMVVSYVLTVQLLRQQKKFGDNLPVSRREQLSCRRRMQQQQHHNRWTTCRGLKGTSNSNQSQSNSSIDAMSRRSTQSSSDSSGISWSTNNGHLSYHKPRVPQVSTCDRSTQTSLNVSEQLDQRRSLQLRSFRLNLPKSPSTFHLRFLASRKRSSMVSNSVANEQKASKVLGIVFSTFVVCWAPFFVLNMVFAACPSCHVSVNIVDTCLWLGYVSSTINPIIYTIFNRTFKEAFIRLLLCRCVFRRRYASTTIYRYVDSLVQTPTPTQNSLNFKSVTTYYEGQESMC